MPKLWFYHHALPHSTPNINTFPQDGEEIYKEGGHHTNKIKKLKKTPLGGLPMPLVREWSAMLVVGLGFNTN